VTVPARTFYTRVFSEFAEEYHRRHDQVRSAGRLRALELLAARTGELVLDLACGPGNLAAEVLTAGASVVGADIAEGMLRVAAHQVPAARFVRMDMECLGMRDGAFDAVVCGHGYQFASDLLRAFAEVRRVLRPGGRLVATVPAGIRSRRLAALVVATADRCLNPPPDVAGAVDRRQLADPAALRAAALEAGFARADVERVPTVARWESPERFAELAARWWDSAVRAEGLPADRLERYRAELTRTLDRALGGRPVELAGVDNVLHAVRGAGGIDPAEGTESPDQGGRTR
jgi:SAM-dependent methyltransferase